MTNDVERYKKENVIKKVFTSIKDLEDYWLDKNLQYINKYPDIGTAEEAKEITNKTIKDIADGFQDGDEFIHYDDYCYDSNGISISRLSSEKLLLRRDGKIVKSILIRMS